MDKLFCIDCNTELNYWAKYKNCKKCKSCSHKGQIRREHKIDCQCGVCKAIRGETKGIKKSEETKIKFRKSHRFEKRHPLSLILRKKLSEIRIKNGHSKGSNNPSWIDGRSYEFYPSEFTEQLKEQIRKRNTYICQNCGMTEEEHIIVYGRKLSVHHIDYNKKNCDKDNLITLCQGCNLRANYNRSYWHDFYKNKIIILTENGGITNGTL
jgi:hypothetical protein